MDEIPIGMLMAGTLTPNLKQALSGWSHITLSFRSSHGTCRLGCRPAPAEPRPTLPRQALRSRGPRSPRLCRRSLHDVALRSRETFVVRRRIDLALRSREPLAILSFAHAA